MRVPSLFFFHTAFRMPFILLFFFHTAFSLTLTFLIIICLGEYLLRFILFGILCANCTYISISFFRFGKFPAIISSNTFSIPFYLSSPSGSLMHKLTCFILSHRSHILLSFFFLYLYLSFCLLFWLDDFHYSIFQITYLFCIIQFDIYGL